MAERKDKNDEFNPRHRIVGAVILVALAVIFLPMLLSDRPPETQTAGLTDTPVPDIGAVVNPASRPGEQPGKSAAAPPATRTVTVPVEPAAGMKGSARPESAGTETTKSASVRSDTPAPVVEPPPPKEKKAAAMPSKPASVASKPAALEKGWVVQVGVFSQRDNARRLQERIQQKGYRVRLDPSSSAAGRSVRVEVGPYREAAEAKAAAARLQDQFGIKGLVRSH